jgi:polar amino acid transport system substrate-binding protein
LKVLTFPSQSAAQLAMESGQADAWLTTGTTATYVSSKSGGGLKMQNFTFAPQPQGAAFKKGDPLADDFLKGMNTLIENGKYQEILKKYEADSFSITKSEKNVLVLPK